MRMRVVFLVAAVVGFAILGFAPAAFAAQHAPKAPNVFRNIPVSGTTSSAGTFEGTFDIDKFRRSNGTIYAVGRVVGVIDDVQGTTPVTKKVRLPVQSTTTARAARATCQVLQLDLAPTDLDLLGLVVHLSAVHLRITAVSGPGKLLGNLLCAIVGLLDRTAATASGTTARATTLARATQKLNKAVRVLTGPDVFHGIPVTGTTPSGGVFKGSLNVRRFANDDGTLVAVSQLSGRLISVTGDVSHLAPTTVRVPVQRTASTRVGAARLTCPVLSLDLGPLHLDLLGLVVDLNQIHLRITAVSGPGNLLGNLLCGIVGILDRQTTTTTTAANRLNALRGLTGRLENIPISGSGFSGVVDVQRFVVRNGHLRALGRLSGTLMKSGSPVDVTNRLVRMPAKLIRGDTTIAARATCPILRLRLGPLHLDLLGLVVDLNQIRLRLTAVSGAGNLLGNLLCQVAGLLDPAPLRTTATRLNSNLLILRQLI